MSEDAAAWVPLFPDDEIPHILSAILRCAKRLEKKHDTELENTLSDRLRDLLDRDAGLRQRPVELLREVPLYDRVLARERCMGRIDMGFLFSTGSKKPWPYFAIECKRLRVKFPSGLRSLAAEYVKGGRGREGKKRLEGDEQRGMMCFIDGRYAPGLKVGGMLGYVFDDRVDEAVSSVSAEISKEMKALNTKAPHCLVASTILAEDPFFYETVHLRDCGDITLYHLFVAV
jgi:hypothetical protein